MKWEYLALNLKKVPGQEGWEFVAVAQDYAVFKRPIAS